MRFYNRGFVRRKPSQRHYARGVEMNEWNPMSTAPKDRRIIVYSPKYGESFIVFHGINPDDEDNQQWVIARGIDITFIVANPSAWQECPVPPKELSTETR